MRVAVVGAGLAGLGATYFLIKKGCSVTLFDELGVGGGASGIPIGLCHPYLGRSGKPSKFADEAMSVTRELIDVAESTSGKRLADRSGILRTDWNPTLWYPDLENVEGGILIKSGMTVLMREYVNALYASFSDVELVKRRISSEDELKEFDRIIFACGSGTGDLRFDLPLSFVKGQVLIGKFNKSLERTIMKARGHLSPFKDGRVQLGSTYEHHFSSSKPDQVVAIRDLQSKMDAFFLNQDEFVFEECFSGVRACVKEGYLPIVERMSEKAFVFTGLGSRGLLYHAYYGRHLADMVI